METAAQRNGTLKNFTKFTGKHPHQSLFLNKVAGWGWDSGIGVFMYVIEKN